MNGNYTGWGLYNDAADPRILVPKRIPAFGWTINIGHTPGRMTLAAIAALVTVSVIVSVATR